MVLTASQILRLLLVHPFCCSSIFYLDKSETSVSEEFKILHADRSCKRVIVIVWALGSMRQKAGEEPWNKVMTCWHFSRQNLNQCGHKTCTYWKTY